LFDFSSVKKGGSGNLVRNIPKDKGEVKVQGIKERTSKSKTASSISTEKSLGPSLQEPLPKKPNAAPKVDSFERVQPRVENAKRYSEIANRHVEGDHNQYDTLYGILTDEFEEGAKSIKVH
ncbi:hypothetical protein ANCCAN_09961, partial [Ancylostoma caninum]